MNAPIKIPATNVRAPSLYAVLLPFVGAKLRPPIYDSHGWPVSNAFVDIEEPGRKFMDADVRDVSVDGVSVFSLGSRLHFIPWSEVRGVRIRRDYVESADDIELVNAWAAEGYVPAAISLATGETS